ncbi:kinase-like domain-containing protein [Mycena maculata]|uniref:Kinase-like domain-containing protein n=1 Tax=Mycena maculata TaxID=230809 RepID=A0AAD7NZW5_9AGAR|nr:kinase-like domain-containing protein [Mycena maculata]
MQPAALRVVKFLGQGGFGAVLQVKVHGKTLALKRLVNTNKRSRRIWDAFAAEVMVHQLMADHPAFPNVHAVFKGPGFLYVAMDCGVASFATIGRMSLRNALFYSGQLVLALHALHKRGVVHLDIKPENLLVGADGNLLVIDFGLARKLDSQPVDPSKFPTWNSVRLARTDRFPLLWVGPQNPHKDDVVCGTLQYMCPQIHFGLAYSFGADLWALGVVMHEWITGEMPDIYEVEGRNIHAWRASPKYWYSPVDRSFFAQIFCVDDPGRFAHYQELKAHRIWQPPNRSWDWNSLEKRQHCPPFSPG